MFHFQLYKQTCTNLVSYCGQVLAAPIWSLSFRLLLELREEVIHLQWKTMVTPVQADNTAK